jgi:hypothetical protein
MVFRSSRNVIAGHVPVSPLTVPVTALVAVAAPKMGDVDVAGSACLSLHAAQATMVSIGTNANWERVVMAPRGGMEFPRGAGRIAQSNRGGGQKQTTYTVVDGKL